MPEKIDSTVVAPLPGYRSIEEMRSSARNEIRFGKGMIAGGVAMALTGVILLLKKRGNKEFRDEVCIPLIATGPVAGAIGLSAVKEGEYKQVAADRVQDAVAGGAELISNP